MAERLFDARKTMREDRANAARIAAEQEAATRARGYSGSGFESVAPRPVRRRGDEPLPYSGPGDVSASATGGALDDPSVKITVGPDGVVRREKR